MRVSVKPVGFFRKYLAEDEEFWFFDLKKSITIGKLLKKTRIEEKEKYFVVFINGRQSGLDYVLNDGDEIVIMLPVDGG